MDCIIKSRGYKIQVFNTEGRPKIFISPTFLAKWPRLGKDGFAKDDIKRAKQELTCTGLNDTAYEFVDELEKVEMKVLEEMFANPQILRSTKFRLTGSAADLDFADFVNGAKRVVRQGDSFSVRTRVVDYNGKRLDLVSVVDDDGNDLRDTDLSPIVQGDHVVVRFHLEPYTMDDKGIYGCTCKLLSIVRKSKVQRKKKRKFIDYTWIVEKKKRVDPLPIVREVVDNLVSVVACS